MQTTLIDDITLDYDNSSRFDKYAVTFQIFYETVFGQTVAVIGSTKQLGNWQKYLCKLKWTEGHIWKSEEPLEMQESRFEYKYVLLNEDDQENIQWEQGVNRIADLNILPNMVRKSKKGQRTPREVDSVKHILLNDDWEQFKVRFTLFDPKYEIGDEMWLIPDSLSGLDQIQMNRTMIQENWLKAKYGVSLDLWEGFLTLQNQNGDSTG